MLLKENTPLACFTTFGIGGQARWFVEASNEEEITEAAAWAGEHGTALVVLGGGSNLLVADAGFGGLVVHVAVRGISVTEGAEGKSQAGEVIYAVAAGEDWEHFVQRATEDGCAGIECLAGIPGTVGGTPVQNVGAYGQEVASVIVRVRAFDVVEHTFAEFTGDECGFGYRKSRFNTTDRGRYLVTRVDYRLTRGGAPTVRYADLQKALADGRAEGGQPSLVEVAAAVRRVRQTKGMLIVDGDPDCRSAGSFFKNPVVTEEQIRRIAAGNAVDPPRFPAGSGAENAGQVKVPAAWLIEQAGFHKGYALGRAGISSKHTLALVNRGEASAAEILALAAQITARVEEQFGIRLEMEPVMIGF